MPFAVHNLHSRSVEIDHELSYSVQPGGPRFTVTPLSMGDGPAIFADFDEAEAWRGKRLAEMKGEANG
jgi:hypothetical protein